MKAPWLSLEEYWPGVSRLFQERATNVQDFVSQWFPQDRAAANSRKPRRSQLRTSPLDITSSFVSGLAADSGSFQT
jgi:hypothetical protein